MSEPDQENANNDAVKTMQKYIAPSPVVVWVGIGVVIIAWLIMFGFSFRFDKSADQLNFLTVNTLGLLSFAVVCISAITAMRQWEVTTKQEIEMTETRKIIKDQHKVMLDTLELTEKTFYLGERAYLEVSNMSVEQFTAGQPIKLKFTIHNGGRTPAFNIKALMQGIDTHGDHKPKVPPDTPDRVMTEIHKQGIWIETFTNHIILPQGKSLVNFVTTVPLKQDKIAAWETGDLHHWIAVKVLFNDIKGDNRWVIFLNEYSKKDGLVLGKCYSSDTQDKAEKNPN